MSEHIRAKAWRKRRNLSVQDLAKLTGYSAETIWAYERGCMTPGEKLPSRPIPEVVWKRFKSCCAGIDAELKHNFKFRW
jgi:DNA-binding XRE family transcriptional regulator